MIFSQNGFIVAIIMQNQMKTGYVVKVARNGPICLVLERTKKKTPHTYVNIVYNYKYLWKVKNETVKTKKVSFLIFK
jgi:hypothetical protein